jgi:hypothetical protein
MDGGGECQTMKRVVNENIKTKITEVTNTE